jgi:hypothetical protein
LVTVLVGVLFLLWLCCSTVFAAPFSFLALRVLRAGQYPSPGMRVLWDMSIRREREAMVGQRRKKTTLLPRTE